MCRASSLLLHLLPVLQVRCPPPPLRIYSGRVVSATDAVNFPFHLQLTIGDGEKVMCGGVLIAKK